jgi:hypothetical protein
MGKRRFKKLSRGDDSFDLLKEKTDQIDYAFSQLGIKSFADLGGVWGVDGGYTFYALENYPVESCFLVDLFFSDNARRRSKHFKQLKLIQADFGSQDTIRQLPELDAIFLFDVLLHQVGPDWQEIVRMYSAITRCFIVFNPQWVGQDTVRLTNLPADEYFENVPHSIDEEPYATVFSHLDEIDPRTGRKHRDNKGVWQWGITDKDLCALMEELGFAKVCSRNSGPWGALKNFELHAFVFASATCYS